MPSRNLNNPRSSKPEKEKRRRAIAAAVVSGKKTKAIAREVGIGEREVRRIAAQPATRLLIADLMRPHHEALRKLAGEAVKAVERGLKAKTSTGKHLHKIQLRAVGRFGDLAHLAQGEAVTGRRRRPGDLAAVRDDLQLARRRCR